MIGGYASVTPLEDEEADLLADLVAARLATEVVITAWRVGHYPGNTAYSTSSEPAARAFLDSIEARGTDAVARRFRDACRGLPYRRATTDDLLERRSRALPRSPLFYCAARCIWSAARASGCSTPMTGAISTATTTCPSSATATRGSCARSSQQQRLLATHSRYLHEAIVELAERLKATLPSELDAILIVNSGSEANDLAWRIARAATGRAGAIVTDYAYHGLTEATARPVAGGMGQGGASRPRGDDSRARRVPGRLPA